MDKVVSNKPIVVLTRTENDLEEMRAAHDSVTWVNFPLIKFDYQELSADIKNEVNELYDWLIFTSQNGVKSFFDQVEGIIDLTHKKIACVGPKTATLVEDYGHKVDFLPSHYTSLVLAKELPNTSEESICYIGGNLSRYETLQILKQKAKHFMQLEVYHTVSSYHSKEQWVELLSAEPSVISFCSPSAVTSFVSQLDKYQLKVPEMIRYAAIGTTTSAAILEDLEAISIIGKKHTFDSMIQAILDRI